MPTKHTPGPWTIERKHEMMPGEVVKLDDPRGVKRCPIATVNGLGPEAVSNANLLAAAPDLLDALKDLDASWSEDLPEGPDTPERNGVRIWPRHAELWRRIRSIIAKAEGKS